MIESQQRSAVGPRAYFLSLFVALLALNSGCSKSRDSKSPRYVSQREGLPGRLQGDFVEFSLDYPDTFRLVPREEHSNPDLNYAVFKRHDSSGDVVLETLSIGSIATDGSRSDVPALYRTFAQLSQDIMHKVPNSRKVSEGPTTIGTYEGYELRFVFTIPVHAILSKEHKGQPLPGELQGKDSVEVWFRAVALLPPGGTKGVTFGMIVTSCCPEVRGIEEVGVKGELPHLLQSFKFR